MQVNYGMQIENGLFYTVGSHIYNHTACVSHSVTICKEELLWLCKIFVMTLFRDSRIMIEVVAIVWL